MSTTPASDNESVHAEPGVPTDHFATLGLTPHYDLSNAEITGAYRSKARETHPDRFAGASADTLAAATRLSAAVNEAYRTLLNPVARAEYMLIACGGPGPDAVREVPGNLLVEVMTMREEIDADKASGDRDAIERHRIAITKGRSDVMGSVVTAAGKLNTATDDEKKDMRIAINAIKYYDNLLEQLTVDPLGGHGA